MNSYRLATICAASLLALACAAPEAPPPPAPVGPTPDEMVAGAKSLEERWIAAMNARDVEALVACYAEDAVSYPPDVPVARGKDAIRAAFAQSFATMPAGAKAEILDGHHQVAGDVVLGHGTWRMTLPNPDGAPIVIEGRFTDVKARRGGQWVYTLDHASLPMPPPPAEPAAASAPQ